MQVLASPETATDDDYARIEGVVAHEYFHNWTGNRVTCRDWFQLTLKEGLTVFRDQVQQTAGGNSADIRQYLSKYWCRTRLGLWCRQVVRIKVGNPKCWCRS